MTEPKPTHAEMKDDMIDLDRLEDTKRIIVVDRQFYVQLMEYLIPTERWSSRDEAERYGLVLYAFPSKRLIFVPADEVSPSTPSE